MARKMKDSGIEWIGEIPEGWNVGKVSYFFDIQLGKMLQPIAHKEDDTLEYYLCAANLGGNCLKTDNLKQMWFSKSEKSKYEVRKGDLLVVEGGDVASCDIVKEDANGLCIQNAIHRVRNRSGFDERILRYYLMVAKSVGYIDLICNKATIAHFTKEKLASMPMPAIPIEEQHVIADFLDLKCERINAAIEKTKASIEEYKKLKQAIITQAVTKGIRPNRPMKDSGVEWIGEIPEDWNIFRIANLYDERNENGNEDLPIRFFCTDRGSQFKDALKPKVPKGSGCVLVACAVWLPRPGGTGLFHGSIDNGALHPLTPGRKGVGNNNAPWQHLCRQCTRGAPIVNRLSRHKAVFVSLGTHEECRRLGKRRKV